MSITDNVAVGDMLLTPEEFVGLQVKVRVSYFTAPPAASNGDEDQQQRATENARAEDGQSDAIILVPIRVWESMHVVGAKLAAYEQQFAPAGG